MKETPGDLWIYALRYVPINLFSLGPQDIFILSFQQDTIEPNWSSEHNLRQVAVGKGHSNSWCAFCSNEDMYFQRNI